MGEFETETDPTGNTAALPVVVLPVDAEGEAAALAARQVAAGGVLMKAVTMVGGQVEDGLKMLPAENRARIEAAARKALLRSYEIAARSRTGQLGELARGERAHRIIGTVSGVVGGLGGLPTALMELPVTTTVIFRAVQDIAEANGEDPTSEATRIECLRVFGAGGPGGMDDGVDTSFVGARLSITGAAVHGVISRVAPKFAAVLSQKLASQAVPLLGAAAGAGTNYAFIRYYTEVAQVHFGLRRLARAHGEAAVLEAFHAALEAKTRR
ncbi:MAG: EcsC family protein [Marivivens sp.]|nr:EcsC family protein [Marivivens sp.]